MREDGKVGAKRYLCVVVFGEEVGVREDVMVWKGKSEGEESDGREGHEIRRMGGKKARRDTGSKVGAAIVQCGEEEKEDDGRAEGEGTVLCRELRGSQEAQRSAVSECVCVGERSAHTATGGGSSSSSSRAGQLCGTRSLPGCALPGQEVQGPGPGTCLALPLSVCLSASVRPLCPQRGMAKS